MNLQKIRNEKKYSQSKLASMLGISRSAVAMWESGASEPDTKMLLKIANIFDVSVDYLLGREENDGMAAAPVTVQPTEADLKIALFGGDGEVTDEMWDEVKRFAEFVKQNKGKK